MSIEQKVNSRKKLLVPPDSWHPLLFIMALSEEFPMWAERQRSNSRNPTTSLTLAALITDITDEARNKERHTEGGSALYGGRPNPNSNKGKGKGNDKKGRDTKDKIARRGKLCKNCKNPNALHDPDKCFVTNHKLRKAWEEKNNTKFVPYKQKEADKKKDDGNESDRSYADVSAMSACLPGIKNSEEGTLFDTGADQHFAKSIDDFDEGTFIQSSNKQIVNTAGGPTQPTGTGKRSLICVAESEGTVGSLGTRSTVT